MRKPITKEQALIRLQASCAKAEHCCYEMLQKLRLWNIQPQQAKEIIDSLKEDRFIDDERFAKAFARDKFLFSHWGKRKIHQALILKRIPKEYVNEALSLINDNDYEESIRNILLSKIRLSPELTSDYEGRTKLYRFGLQRGFEPDIVSKSLKSIISKR